MAESDQNIKALYKLALSILICILTIVSGALHEMLTTRDAISSHANMAIFETAVFLCWATVSISFLMMFWIAYIIQRNTVLASNILLIIYYIIISVGLLVLTVFFFMLLLNIKFAWLTVILFTIFITIIWLLITRRKETLQTSDFSIENSKINEQFLKLIIFATTVACTGIVGAITANVRNNATHHDGMELFVLFLFFTALGGFCSMLLILIPPVLIYIWRIDKVLLTFLVCASFIALELSGIAIAYDLVKSIYIAIIPVPIFVVTVAYLTFDFYKRNVARQSDEDSKLMDMWVLSGGVNFTVLTVVYGLHWNNNDTPAIIKNFVVIIVSAFVCCLIHMLLELLKPQRGQGSVRNIFFKMTVLLHMIGALSLGLALTRFTQ